ncbi:MAG: alpha/beta hydrolase [Bacteroidetes bacterium]|nr:alpha/beta hydrolase [Bacteroidota bacterium]
MKPVFKKILWVLGTLFILLNVICAVQAYRFTHYYDNIPEIHFSQMSFFQKANTLILGEKVRKEKVVDSLSVPHTTETILTEDGIRLACWNLKHPENDSVKPKGTLLMFHGHGSCRSGIIPDATFFYHEGWNVFMIDFRAHGESSGNTCTIGYFEAWDVKAAYDFVKASGETHIAMFGVSLGAATITKTIHDYPYIQPSKIILESPFGTMKDAAEGRIRSMKLPVEPLTAILLFWGSVENGYWAISNKPEEYIKSVKCPVLLQWGEDDDKVTKKEIDDIYQNIHSQKELVIYKNCGHESICRNNFSKWSATVSAFLNTK